MKKMNYRLLLIVGLLLSLPGFAQNGIEKKITKEFAASPETEFIILHKFGEISIENWDQQKILVEATIIADTKKPEKAEKLFRDVEIDFSTNLNEVKVKTYYDSKIVQKDVSVNYQIKMPHYISIDLTNKFGSVFINEISGKSKIEVSYGSIKAKKLLNDDSKALSRLTLAYGSAEIEKCNWLHIDTKYSAIEINKAKALLIDSRFSNIEIDDSYSIVATSKYDNYENGSTRNLALTSKFSNFEIGNIFNKLELNVEYGSFSAGNMAAGFELINITNRFAGIDIQIDENASYNLDAQCDFCELDYPSNSDVNHYEDGTENRYKGFIGNDRATKSKVTVKSKYGGVDLD